MHLQDLPLPVSFWAASKNHQKNKTIHKQTYMQIDQLWQIIYTNTKNLKPRYTTFGRSYVQIDHQQSNAQIDNLQTLKWVFKPPMEIICIDRPPMGNLILKKINHLWTVIFTDIPFLDNYIYRQTTYRQRFTQPANLWTP